LFNPNGTLFHSILLQQARYVKITAMQKNTPRREDGLSCERIIEESIALLDSRGEAGLTFALWRNGWQPGPAPSTGIFPIRTIC
jgi:hypothetical protein